MIIQIQIMHDKHFCVTLIEVMWLAGRSRRCPVSSVVRFIAVWETTTAAETC